MLVLREMVLIKCLAQYLARKHLVNVALIVTGSFALPGLAAALVRAQLCISVGLNVELNYAAGWATKWLLSCSPAFLLEPHGSPGLNHITCAKAWRQNAASEAAGVIRAGSCEHVYVWWREGRRGEGRTT